MACSTAQIELARIRNLAAFSINHPQETRWVNQHLRVYTFEDGSKLTINTTRGRGVAFAPDGHCTGESSLQVNQQGTKQ